MSSRRRSARAAARVPSPEKDAVAGKSSAPTTSGRGSPRKSAIKARAALQAPPQSLAVDQEPGSLQDDEPGPQRASRGQAVSRETSKSRHRAAVKQASSEQEAVSEAEAASSHGGNDAAEEQGSDEGNTKSAARSRKSPGRASVKRRASRGARQGRAKRRATTTAVGVEDSALEEEDVSTPPANPLGEAEVTEEPDTVLEEGEDESQEAEDAAQPHLAADSQGDTKVDTFGNLLGGREYRCPVLSFPQRGRHKFVLTRDAARTLDYRDANYFCRMNKVLRVVRLDPEERDLLIQLELIRPHLKGRPISVVYARDLFQHFGARIVAEGRKVVDDYYESQVVQNGAVSGETAVHISRDRIRDEKRKRLRVERAQARLVFDADRTDAGGGEESGSEAVLDSELQSQVTHLREVNERRERDREREKLRRRLLSSTYTHLSPSGEPVTTTFGDAGADPFTRVGPGAAKNAARKAALARDGLNEQNWMLKFALSTAATARTHASLRERGLARLPVPPTENNRGEIDAEPILSGHELQLDSATGSNSAGDAHGTDQVPDTDNVPAQSDSEEGDIDGPVGVYEPGTNRVQVGRDTQPTWAKWTKTSSTPEVPGLEPGGEFRLPGLGEVPQLLSRAWGVMSVHTTAHLPPRWRREAEEWDLTRRAQVLSAEAEEDT